METEVILKILAYDRPGVLDRIAGLIRRKGWNISSLTAGDVEKGLSQINIALKGRGVDAQVLGEHLDELDAIHSWEECQLQSHVIRELVMFRIHKSQDPLPNIEGIHIAEKRDCMLFAEYTGTPWEVDELICAMREKMISCVRTGPLVFSQKEEQ